MESKEDNALNSMLDQALLEAKKIGMRGELIDLGSALKLLRDKYLKEMQNKEENSDDDDVNAST